MPTINDRIGSQNVIRVLSNASAPPTRIVNLTDVNTARKNEDGMLLVWDLSQEAFYMSDVLDAYGYQFTGGPDASGITTFSGTTNSISVTTGSVTFAGGIGVGKNLNLGGQLAVTGISTFSNTVDVNADVDILRGLNVAGISSVQSLSIGSTQVISSARELQNITSLDATTTATIEEAIKVAPNTFTDLKISGISTFIGIATFGGGIAVQAGVSTFDAAVDINAGLDVDGQTDLDELIVAGVTTFNNADVVFQGAAGGQNITFDASENDLEFTDAARIKFGNSDDLEIWHDSTNSNIKNSTGDFHIRSDSLALKTADNSERYLKATKNEDVKLYYNGNEKFATTSDGVNITGHVETDTLNVSGLSTFAGAIDVNGSANIVGGLTLDQLNVTGVSTFGDDSIITAGGLDVTGIVTATGLDISTGGVDIDGQTDLDELNVTGVSTFQSDVVIVGDSANVQWDRSQNSLEFSDSGYATFGDGRDLQIYHDSFNTYLDNNTGTFYLRSVSGTGGGIYLDPTSTSRGLVVSPNGAVEAYWNNLKRFETSGIGITVTGQLDSTTLNVSGVSTFSSLVDVNNRIDVVGGANVDQLNVTGVSTLTGDVTLVGSVNQINVTGVSTFSSLVDVNNRLDVVGGANIDQVNVSGVSTFNDTLHLPDDKSITLGNDDDLELHHIGGSNSYIKNNTGQFEIRSDTININSKNNATTFIKANASGIMATTGIVTATELNVSTGGLDVDGQTDLDELVVAGVSTFSAAIDANVGANIVGGLTLDELNVTGVSTFSAAGTIIGGGGMDVTGIITATEIDIGTGGLDVDGQTDLDELVVAGIATFITDVNITGMLTAGAIDGGSF